MSNNISVLLPGSFFEKDYQKKISYLSKNQVDCVYLFDHSVNPVDERKAVYDIKKALSLLQESSESNFKLGICVLNINNRKKDLLFSNFINPFMEIKDFRLGLGTGDNRYENRTLNYANDLDAIISELVSEYTFSLNGRNLFIGGTSRKKKDLVSKYSIGINQWLGNSIDLINLHKDLYIKDPLIGKFSQCIKTNDMGTSLPDSFEKIFILKDMNTKKFFFEIDKIFL